MIRETISFSFENEEQQRRFHEKLKGFDAPTHDKDGYPLELVARLRTPPASTRDAYDAAAEIERLRARDALVGNLIDQWEMMPNDLLGAVEDGAPSLASAMKSLITHLTTK